MVKTLIIKYGIYANILLKKNEATHIFSAKNTCELDTVLSRKINILTAKELVKLKAL